MDRCPGRFASFPSESRAAPGHRSGRGPPSRTCQPRRNSRRQIRPDEQSELLVPVVDFVSTAYRRPDRPTEISDSAQLTPFSTNDTNSHAGKWDSGQEAAGEPWNGKPPLSRRTGFSTKLTSGTQHSYRDVVVGLICSHNRNLTLRHRSAALIQILTAAVLRSPADPGVLLQRKNHSAHRRLDLACRLCVSIGRVISPEPHSGRKTRQFCDVVQSGDDTRQTKQVPEFLRPRVLPTPADSAASHSTGSMQTAPTR